MVHWLTVIKYRHTPAAGLCLKQQKQYNRKTAGSDSGFILFLDELYGNEYKIRPDYCIIVHIDRST